MIFNARARKTISDTLVEQVEIAYNPVLRMIVIHKSDEDDSRTLKWVKEKDDGIIMRK